uniref:Uncharacterized protein n=1 Tax=Candidatus Kentrum sp. LPFa TaxID=2126335 RepID=A0A450W368_9GAMM|nr:MAG: hypothetical protein BECKLPF1236A_GA0070988_100565 [Candidatus Kentron sp. LPFa]VFK27658.1 MAG: hypothetical protein BECKLPF1236C_GA0070990_100505 [Candidatus Kentron sp. LPFa]
MEYSDAFSLELARSSSAAPQRRFSTWLLFVLMDSSVWLLPDRPARFRSRCPFPRSEALLLAGFDAKSQRSGLGGGRCLSPVSAFYCECTVMYCNIPYNPKNWLKRLPEKNIPECAEFSFIFKAAWQAHSGLCNCRAT